MVSEDTMHTQLTEDVTREFETAENESILMKVWLKDRQPPLTLLIRYQDEKNRDLTLFTSPNIREPSSFKNHGSHSGVSSIKLFDIFIEKQNFYTRNQR